MQVQAQCSAKVMETKVTDFRQLFAWNFIELGKILTCTARNFAETKQYFFEFSLVNESLPWKVWERQNNALRDMLDLHVM